VQEDVVKIGGEEKLGGKAVNCHASSEKNGMDLFFSSFR
jgi:hypothetical protein